MALTVHSCVTYVPTFGGAKTQDQWAALHFVNAIKRTPLAGFAVLPLPAGDNALIDRHSADLAPHWFATLAVSALPWRHLLPVALVPVPDARCSVTAGRPPDTLRLADALAHALASALGPGSATTVDVLQWVRPMASAHSADGTRDPQVLYGRLRLKTSSLGPRTPGLGHRVVLVDDVVASGAHLRAAAAFLRDCGATIACAVCAACASDTWILTEPAVCPSVRKFDEFDADPDWRLPEVFDGVEL